MGAALKPPLVCLGSSKEADAAAAGNNIERIARQNSDRIATVDENARGGRGSDLECVGARQAEDLQVLSVCIVHRLERTDRYLRAADRNRFGNWRALDADGI